MKIGQVRLQIGANEEQFVSGDILQDFYPLKAIGIQTIPGAKIYINNNDNYVVIGSTGIYELENIGENIVSIKLDRETLNLIKGNLNTFLIYDFLYE